MEIANVVLLLLFGLSGERKKIINKGNETSKNVAQTKQKQKSPLQIGLITFLARYQGRLCVLIPEQMSELFSIWWTQGLVEHLWEMIGGY